MSPPRVDIDAWLRQLQRSSPTVSVVFGAGTIIFLILMFWLVPQPTDFQRQLVRWIVAICSAMLTTFLFGGIIMHGSLPGLKFSAGGGIAIFILLIAFVDPFPRESPPLGQPQWSGGFTLGTLIASLTEAYADGRIVERIEVDPVHHDEIYNFHPGPGAWTGRTWIEVIRKITVVNPCMGSRIFDNGKTLQLTIIGPIEKHCASADCASYWYTCRL